MTESAFTVHPYLIYAGITFFFMLLLGLLGAILRVSVQVAKIDGRLSGLETAVADLRQDNAELRKEVNVLREQVAEIRGMLRAIHERIDLVMRHRHDETGAVVLTPAETAPVAD